MLAAIEDYLRKAVRPHEVRAVVIAFAYFFCVLAAYFVIRPVRDQFPAAIGSTSLPIFYGAVFVATFALTPVFGALVARYPRRRFVPVVYALVIVGMLAFIPLFHMQELVGPKLLGALFFIWGSVFNLFVVSVFWSFMADVFDAEQARRLFPLIALGGSLGAIVGPALTRSLVFVVGVPALLLVSSLLLVGAIYCVVLLLRWSQKYPVQGDERRDERIIGGSFIAGFRHTMASPMLRRVAILMLLGDAVGTVIYALLTDYSHDSFTTQEARTYFASGIDVYANLLQAVLQVTVTRSLMVRFGAAPVMVLDGVIKAGMLLGLLLFAGPWIAVVAVVTRASAYGVFKPAYDSLFTMVDAEARYKAKNFIDTAVWRFGDVVITTSFNFLRSVGTMLPGFVLLSMTAAAASSWIGWRITRLPELNSDTAARETT